MIREKLDALSKREREVLRYIVRGFQNKEIARILFIAESTVETHLGKIYRKLNVGNRTEAAIIALRSDMEI
jgi:two-component system, NarL family, response regulator